MFKKINNLNLDNLDNSKVYIIEASKSETRKNIHLYLEKHYPKLGKTSLKCNLFNKGDINYLIVKCYECDNKNVIINKYDNIYNYGTGECKKCKTISHYEYTYDDHGKYINGNNIIVLGNYFKKYKNRKSKENKSDQKLEDLITDCKFYEIKTPIYRVSKHNFKRYICLQYSLQLLYLYLTEELVKYIVRKYLHFI